MHALAQAYVLKEAFPGATVYGMVLDLDEECIF